MHPSDDDFELSLSTQRGMEAGANRKQRGFAEKMRRQGKIDLARQAQQINTGYQLKTLQQQLSTIKAAQDKQQRDRMDPDKKGSKMGTKTREQKLAQQREGAADQRPDAGQQTEQNAQDAKRDQEMRKEEVSTEGG